ncbi:MAG: hypothetical protein K2M17_02190 [Bacilli bacterium]|nr:hypothetical protein [Bacilli bacterium]
MEKSYLSGLTTDKSIEYEGALRGIKQRLKIIAEAGIDISEEESEVKTIETQVEQEVQQSKNTHSLLVEQTLMMIYQSGITQLEEKLQKLSKYDDYCDINNRGQAISLDMKNKLTVEKIEAIAPEVIQLIWDINHTATQSYKSEQVIVERIYDLAYLVIKAELSLTGKSTVLNWVKADDTVTHFINALVKQEIAQLNDEDVVNTTLKTLIIMSQQRNANFSYLDEGLLLYLAMQSDSEAIKPIEKEMLELYESLKRGLAKEKDKDKQIKSLRTENEKIKQRMTNSFVPAEIAKLLVSLSICVGIVAGGIKGSKAISTTRLYRTEKEGYSTAGELQNPSIVQPEYLTKIPSFKKVEVTKYEPWGINLGFFNLPTYGKTSQKVAEYLSGYQRNVTTYDVSDNEFSELQDYLELRLTDGKKTTEDYPFSAVAAEDIYDEAIYEVIRYTQDELDFYDKERTIERIIEAIVIIIAGIAASMKLDKFIYKKVDMSFLFEPLHNLKLHRKDPERAKELDQKLVRELEAYKKLCENNEEFRRKFLERYNQFEGLFRDKKITDAYQRLVREKKKSKTATV